MKSRRFKPVSDPWKWEQISQWCWEYVSPGAKVRARAWVSENACLWRWEATVNGVCRVTSCQGLAAPTTLVSAQVECSTIVDAIRGAL